MLFQAIISNYINGPERKRKRFTSFGDGEIQPVAIDSHWVELEGVFQGCSVSFQLKRASFLPEKSAFTPKNRPMRKESYQKLTFSASTAASAPAPNSRRISYDYFANKLVM